MRLFAWLVVAAGFATAPDIAVAGPMDPVQPTPFACAGAEVVAGHKIAAGNGLKIGSDPKACFSHMSIYGAGGRQIIAVAPSAQCPGGKALEVYEASRGGPWYSFFEAPVCGSSVSVGPKNQWGDWMLTIDGRHYDSRGAHYIPVN